MTLSTPIFKHSRQTKTFYFQKIILNFVGKAVKFLSMQLESNGKTLSPPEAKPFIDINEVFRKKGGNLYHFIPKFLIRYLKKTIHEDELNDALRVFSDKQDFDFLKAILTERFTVDIEVKNEENIPSDGRYIIASNHPLGGLDGMALMHVVGRKRKDLKFFANDILLELPNLKNLFVPVNKHGRTNQENVRVIEELYESDQLVLIFPAGLVSRKQKGGIIKDLEWKKSFISKAIQHKRDVIPVYIEGKNSEFFYNLSRFRKRIGLNLNIEMLYLPDEMFRQADKKMTITFGKPVPYTFFTKSKNHREWAQWMKNKVYDMATEHEI
jgi:1-acyl-sn-glycerol-3-phosphate acyltransferase